MIRLLIYIIFSAFSLAFATAQQKDTLSNLPSDPVLYAPEYDGTGQWGFVLGQNSSYRQQFAERYEIDGSTRVTGLIVHLSGRYANPENYVEFNVYEVAANGLPGARIGGKQIFYKDLDLSGNAMTVSFFTPLEVQDSFFVTFNVLDYLHGGFEGDTLSLLAGEPGSRPESDLQNFGRNAVQAHNHAREDWKDFYTQNFTPIATHFALFPIVEVGTVLSTLDELANKDFAVISTYPNPTTEQLNIRYYLDVTSEVSIRMYDVQGKQMYLKESGLQPLGEHQQIVDVQHFPIGTYVYSVESDQSKLIGKVIVR